MEPGRFKNKPGSNILQWLECMERYLTAGQVAEEEHIQVTSTYLEPRVAQHWQAKELEATGQDNCLWKNLRQILIQACGNVRLEQVVRNKLWNLTQKGVGRGLCHQVPTSLCANYKLRVERGQHN